MSTAGAPGPTPIPMPSRETREHLWRDAGLVRSADGLRSLLEDPHPLARIVGQCALLREESRGGHQRSDFPQTDPALDGFHAVIRADNAPVFESWV
jgi:L-aspartate oxidase